MPNTSRSLTTGARRLVWILPAALTVALIAARRGTSAGTSAGAADGTPAPAPAPTVAAKPLVVAAASDVPPAPERSAAAAAGPLISGTLVPRVQAVVRAEVGGAVLATLAERGTRVAAGEPVARIQDRTQRAAYASAQAEVRSAEGDVAAARRRAERLARLLAGGAVSAEEAEGGEQAVEAAEAALAAARSRWAAVAEELSHAVVRSPIAGVVSVRSVGVGDVVQPGAAMFEVLDPSSMRLEAAVPSSQLGALRRGASVAFTVTGYPGRTFTGRVERISPAADPSTRQVPVTITIDNRDGRLVAGLYAEGRIEGETLGKP
ncbi:MAG TPA: efflux RND transporter periplasmic adaptor subunit [Gemmatimonadaceae bacterium]|nr:efflux RND transporter periplasmic adaptor subunit [Gemmatimonadaceae bacterium]